MRENQTTYENINVVYVDVSLDRRSGKTTRLLEFVHNWNHFDTLWVETCESGVLKTRRVAADNGLHLDVISIYDLSREHINNGRLFCFNDFTLMDKIRRKYFYEYITQKLSVYSLAISF
jgi:hypothetical protein